MSRASRAWGAHRGLAERGQNANAEHCQDATIYLVSFHIWKIGAEVMGQNRAGGYP